MEGADMLVPVPLQWRRLLRRKFNQSALFAYGISEKTGVICAPDMLNRVRYTKPQMLLDRATRLNNVQRAFAVAEEAVTLLDDKVVVLVDDVVTQGQPPMPVRGCSSTQVHVKCGFWPWRAP
jgi:predicted amidophosphoribosyltransferase